MPAYLNDDELFYVRRACLRLEETAARLATAERPSEADARHLQDDAASLRLLLERAEARGRVH